MTMEATSSPAAPATEEVHVVLSLEDALAVLLVHAECEMPARVREDGRLLSNEGEVALRIAVRRAQEVRV